ncbi:hypothetical protein W822_13495 [Advenella kashmirensis W13003]|uniref:Nitrogen fixation protein FixH n=1 Tax=Advenella kashmirensis W13003 TaxID=1424334 RepID=V8QQ76_9BURK|nr:FixH family protein [Advenella kashmirensis]ETF01797.1 hypothetical protein W822_13495 [Advenella kashmirensis W13003]
MQVQERDSGPWYKEPWPWLLMAGPFVAIIGCVITIFLAFQNNPDRDMRLDARKQGLVVIREGKLPAAPAPATGTTTPQE